MTNRSRDAFEAWLLIPPKRYPGTTSEWTEMQKEDDWAAWKAGRESALDEAMDALENANARRVVYLPDVIEIIRSLK